MAKFSLLEVLAWIEKLGLSFKEAIIPFSLSCIFPYHQIKVDEPLLRAAANFWIPTQHVFHFNGVEVCPILEEFSAIMGEPKVSTIIFPTIGGGSSCLGPSSFRCLLDMAWHCCMFDKLNIHSIFAYFSLLTVPETNRPRSYYLNAFYLCILARYFLVQETGHLDQRMCLVVSDLRSGNPVGIILAKTLNGLDAFHRKEANLFMGSPLLRLCHFSFYLSCFHSCFFFFF